MKRTSSLHKGTLVLLGIATVTLLAGCSIWPKALTFGSSPVAQQTPPEPVPEPAAAPAPAPAPLSVAQSAPVATPAEPQTQVVAPTTAPEPTPAAPSARKAPTPAGELVPGFYINVGLFSVPANGTNAYAKLESAGLPVFSDGIKTKKGPLTRVRVGPFATRAQADAAAQKIHDLKLEAVVFRHPKA